MWENLFSWFRMIWDAGSETQKNSKSIEAMTEQDRELSEAFKLAVVQQQHDREMNEERVQRAEARIASLERELDMMKTMFNQRLNDEAEKIELRLRLEIAQQRQLPPPSN